MLKNAKRWVPALLLIIVLATVWGLTADSNRGSLSAANRETYQGLKLFSDVLELVEQRYVDEVETKDLVENAVRGMIQSLDPHSTLLDPEEFKELQVDTHGEFTGVGIQISSRDGFVTVVAPIEGTPAHRAGLKAGDRLLKVDGETINDLREAVKKIRGPQGSSVVITIGRAGFNEPKDFTIVRDLIPIESVRHATVKPGYGYVRVTNFSETTAADLEKAMSELKGGDQPLMGLVLDLRDNPGGLLSQAIEVSDMFLKEGQILSMKGRDAANAREFNAQDDEDEPDCPIVVLINKGSASASEIVAGALQDQKRAIILGTTSFGKGSVQNVETLRDGYGLKLTVARYYTPSGRSIHEKGITPDIAVEEGVVSAVGPEEQEADGAGKAEQSEEAPVQNRDAGVEGDDSNGDTQQPIELRTGPLTEAKLAADQQVMRAVEILVSHNLLSGR
jgi:carboxyl-terminal processing protease